MGRGDYMVEPCRGSPRAQVGSFLGAHTVGDREQALAQLSIGFDQLYAELRARALKATPEHPQGLASAASAADVEWWQTVALPVFNAWNAFKGPRTAEALSGPASGYVAWGEHADTAWDAYQEWFQKLSDLRGAAEKRFGKLASPAPTPLTTTAVEDVGEWLSGLGHSVKEKLGESWDLAKFAIYGGLAIGGVLVLSSIVTNVRNRQDPMAPYLAMARRGAGAAAMAAK